MAGPYYRVSLSFRKVLNRVQGKTKGGAEAGAERPEDRVISATPHFLYLFPNREVTIVLIECINFCVESSYYL